MGHPTGLAFELYRSHPNREKMRLDGAPTFQVCPTSV